MRRIEMMNFWKPISRVNIDGEIYSLQNRDLESS
jgi:hypothetical protein